jgi:hypothetical protein
MALRCRWRSRPQHQTGLPGLSVGPNPKVTHTASLPTRCEGPRPAGRELCAAGGRMRSAFSLGLDILGCSTNFLSVMSGSVLKDFVDIPEHAAFLCRSTKNQLDSRKLEDRDGRQNRALGMLRQIAPPSHLPTMILPCPYCGRWMTVISAEPDAVDQELENITHGCTRCGTELIRTVWRLGKTVSVETSSQVPGGSLKSNPLSNFGISIEAN